MHLQKSNCVFSGVLPILFFGRYATRPLEYNIQWNIIGIITNLLSQTIV